MVCKFRRGRQRHGTLQKEASEGYKSLYKKAQEDKELAELAKRPVKSHTSNRVRKKSRRAIN